MILVYLIVICNSTLCTRANLAQFDSADTCLHELPMLYTGSMQHDGKFYIEGHSRDIWLQCNAVRSDDGRLIHPRVKPR